MERQTLPATGLQQLDDKRLWNDRSCELMVLLCGSIPCRFFHHPVDIRQASFPAGVFRGALTAAGLFLQFDSLEDHRFAVLEIILLNLLLRISKAVANQVITRDLQLRWFIHIFEHHV
jgi:hypothetical protein